MARPAKSSRAVAMTLLLTLLLLLLLPAPASSLGASVVGAIVHSPAVRQLALRVIKDVATSGGEALIKQAFKSASASKANDQLGAAAADNAAYILYNVSIGRSAPQQTFNGTLDIFNAFLWVPCPSQPAFHKVPCDSQTCSSTLNTTAAASCGAGGGGDCRYVYDYDSGPNTTGYLANETLAIGGGTTAPPIFGNVVFGCMNTSTATSSEFGGGAIGFSKGSLSVLTQLRISRFSYFLTPLGSGTSSPTSIVLLGEQAVPQTEKSRSTLLFGSNVYPDLYYVQLTSIQVDGVSLTGIPAGAFDLAADGMSGGVVLSTTTPLTFLQKNAYDALRQALVNKIMSVPVSSSGTDDEVSDLCYYTQSVAKLTFPKITLVFAGGDSPAMELTTVHYFYKDNATGLQCLTILPTPDDTPFGSVLGSMLQAGTNMIYDIGARQLTFESGVTATVPSQVSFMVIASLLLVWVLLF